MTPGMGQDYAWLVCNCLKIVTSPRCVFLGMVRYVYYGPRFPTFYRLTQDGSYHLFNCLVPLASFGKKAAHLGAVQNDPKVGVGDGGWNEREAAGHGDRQYNNAHDGGDRVPRYFANLHPLLILTGAFRRSAPAACSVSVMAMLSNYGTKIDLDYRSAFRHVTYQVAFTGGFWHDNGDALQTRRKSP